MSFPSHYCTICRTSHIVSCFKMPRVSTHFGSVRQHSVKQNKNLIVLRFHPLALTLAKLGCSREYKTKITFCFDIPLICSNFAA